MLQIIGNLNNTQVLLKLMALELLKKCIICWRQSASSSRPEPQRALRGVSVCSWAHGSPLGHFFSIMPDKWTYTTFLGEWWLLQASIVLPYQLCRAWRLSLNAFTGCFTLESEHGLLLDPSLPLPMPLIYFGFFREPGHLNSISCVPFCFPTIYTPVMDWMCPLPQIYT